MQAVRIVTLNLRVLPKLKNFSWIAVRFYSDDTHILRNKDVAPPLRNLDLYNHVTERWAKNLDNTALIHAEDESYRLTYGQLHDVIDKVSRGLKKAGLRRGGVVSVWCTNSSALPIMTLAAWKQGAVAALAGASLTAEEASILIKKVDTEFLLVDAITKPKAAKVIPDLPSKIIFSVKGCDVISLAGSSSLKKPAEKPSDGQEGFSVDDPAVILFSSGTTGLPKAVELSHRAFSTALFIGCEPPYGRVMMGSYVTFLPFSHFYGIFLILRIFWSTATLVVVRRFKLDNYLHLLSKYKSPAMHLVPSVAADIVKNRHKVKDYDLSNIAVGYSGSAPLHSDTSKSLKEIFTPLNPNFKISQGYGLTETTGGFTRFPMDYDPEKVPPTTVGQLIPHMEVKIRDVNTGETLPVGREGEILVRGKMLMNGYKGDPKATAETIDSEWWLHTGDVGYYDREGYLFIVDRIKELIKHKGMQVAPAELEDLLMSHDAVLDAAVVGEPDELTGERPVAFIVKRPASSVTEKQLQDFVAERVAGYKQLTGGVRFIDSIPRVASGKILRRELKEILKNTKSKL